MSSEIIVRELREAQCGGKMFDKEMKAMVGENY